MNMHHKSGLISELKVAQRFVAEGYNVYLPIASQARADMIVEKEGKTLKVQVKTASWSKTGKNKYLQCRLVSRNQYRREYEDGDFDVVVFVDGDAMWKADWEEIKGRTSVCLANDTPNPRKSSRDYNPESWRWY